MTQADNLIKMVDKDMAFRSLEEKGYKCAISKNGELVGVKTPKNESLALFFQKAYYKELGENFKLKLENESLKMLLALKGA